MEQLYRRGASCESPASGAPLERARRCWRQGAAPSGARERQRSRRRGRPEASPAAGDDRAARRGSHAATERARDTFTMEGMLRKIADVFQEDRGPDVHARRLRSCCSSALKPGNPPSCVGAGVRRGAAVRLRRSPGRCTSTRAGRTPPMPTPSGAAAAHGRRAARRRVPRRSSRCSCHEMRTAYSQYSLAGLEWLEARAKPDAVVADARAAEDAEIAKKPLQEDSALAAASPAADDERGARRSARRRIARPRGEGGATRPRSGRRGSRSSTPSSRRRRRRAVDAAMAKSPGRRRRRWLKEAAAREAAARAESAAKEAESLVRPPRGRTGETKARRPAVDPISRPRGLPSTLPAAVAFACQRGGGGGRRRQNGAVLRLDDRSWWRMLHFRSGRGERRAILRRAIPDGAQFCGAILSLTRRHRPRSSGLAPPLKGNFRGQRALPSAPRRQRRPPSPARTRRTRSRSARAARRARVDAAPPRVRGANPTLLRLARVGRPHALRARPRHVAPLLHNLHARAPGTRGRRRRAVGRRAQAAVDALYAGKSGTALPAEEVSCVGGRQLRRQRPLRAARARRHRRARRSERRERRTTRACAVKRPTRRRARVNVIGKPYLSGATVLSPSPCRGRPGRTARSRRSRRPPPSCSSRRRPSPPSPPPSRRRGP